MNMAISMIDLSILYGAPVHLFIRPVYEMTAAGKDGIWCFIRLLGPTQGKKVQIHNR